MRKANKTRKDYEMDQRIKSALAIIDQQKDLFCKASDQIWEYAEPPMSEYNSAKLLCELLREEGFDVEEGAGGIPTAFTARYGKGKPVIGILAEYDALGGLSQEAGLTEKKPIKEGDPGHGCGHNSLGAGTIAAAFAIKKFLDENPDISGTVICYGCPGEEGGAGKVFMAREGLFDELDCAIAWHPSIFNGIMGNSNNANCKIKYTFKGIASHAAGDPQMGRSALDAVELMNVGVQFLREHMIDAARIHYAITDTGGYSPNVVQSKAEVLYLIRAPKYSLVDELRMRVDKIAQGAALMTETKVQSQFLVAYSNYIVNKTLDERIFKYMQELPLPTYTDKEQEFAKKLMDTCVISDRLPARVERMEPPMKERMLQGIRDNKTICDFLLPFCPDGKSSPGSTDVGDVSWICPTAEFVVTTEAMLLPAHSWQYVSCGKTSIAHKGLLHAGKIMSASVIDWFLNPEVIKEAKAEHMQRRQGVPYQCPIPKNVSPIPISDHMKN